VVSCILSIWRSHHILWHLISLTMFSPLIMASNLSFRRILYNSLNKYAYYIKIYLEFDTFRVMQLIWYVLCHAINLIRFMSCN
jgi:hypothetical protein